MLINTMVIKMIDKIIKWIAEQIARFALPSTILKLSLTALIVSLPLCFLLGYWIIILVMAGNQAIWLVTEYLYAKQMEEEDELTDGSE